MLKFSGFACLTSCLERVRAYSSQGVPPAEMHEPGTPEEVCGRFCSQQEDPCSGCVKGSRMSSLTHNHTQTATPHVVDHAAGMKWLGH